MLVREKMVGIDGGGDERESGEFREKAVEMVVAEVSRDCGGWNRR